MKRQKKIIRWALQTIVLLCLFFALVGCGKQNTTNAPTKNNTETPSSPETSSYPETVPFENTPKVIENTLEESIEVHYAIEEALTDFSGNRAWVTYFDNNNSLRYGLINEKGVLIVTLDKENAFESLKDSPWIGETYPDGFSCFYKKGNWGMVLFDSMGEVTFDSRKKNQRYIILLFGLW